jgi:pSer/pThr/pTyr-binding forkhead associated (FHA) protein
MPTLLLEFDSGPSREEPLRDPDTTIGRASCNHIVIEARRISRIHAVLTRYGSIVSIRDLGSTNGTYVNGRRVTNQVLEDGDVIEIGDIHIRYLDAERRVVASTSTMPMEMEMPAREPEPEPEPAFAPPVFIPPPPRPRPAPSIQSPVSPQPPLLTEEYAPLAELLDGPLDDLLDDEDAQGAPFPEWIEDTVAFHFRADGRDVEALITYEALEDHFGAGALLGAVDIRCMEAYRQNAPAINAVAARRYALGRREPVFLRTTDF